MLVPTLNFEEQLWEKGCRLVAGIDEVGRGAWAGPLVVAAVILPARKDLLVELINAGLRDSKKLTEKKRLQLVKTILSTAIQTRIAASGENIINQRGIVFATQTAMRKALNSFSPAPEHILVDAFHIRYIPKKRQTAIVKGDARCLSIAAASILAKVYRDNLMQKKYHHLYPLYGFDRHKGYGTKAHQEAIRACGLCPIHRTSFIPNHLL